jgi:predicted CoA-binding protein
MMSTDSHSPSEIQEILRLKNVAVVGMSNTDGKPANFVPKYLMENGYNVIPVNPIRKEVLGKKSYASVSEIPEQVDIVDIFRRSEDVPPVVDDAKKKEGIKIIWMQSGIYNKDAERKAKETQGFLLQQYYYIPILAATAIGGSYIGKIIVSKNRPEYL